MKNVIFVNMLSVVWGKLLAKRNCDAVSIPSCSHFTSIKYLMSFRKEWMLHIPNPFINRSSYTDVIKKNIHEKHKDNIIYNVSVRLKETVLIKTMNKNLSWINLSWTRKKCNYFWKTFCNSCRCNFIQFLHIFCLSVIIHNLQTV